MSRHFWVLAHRYAGLYMAFFLTVAGLTGSVLAFYHELDRWLYPEWYGVPARPQAMLDPLELRERALALAPQARIDTVRFRREPGVAYSDRLAPRTDPATGKPYALDYTMIRLDLYTGELLEFAKDEGYWPLTRKNILNFIYALHYSLALGEVGMWLFGVAALAWIVDCFVGFYLTLPKWRRTPHPNPLPMGEGAEPRGFWSRWAVAWKIKWRGSAYRVNFDLHRAGGLWTWAMLFVFACSSVALNLGEQVYTPVMKFCCGMRDPVADLPALPRPRPDPGLDWRAAHGIGQRLMAAQARLRGVAVQHENFLIYRPAQGVFLYAVHSDLDVGDKSGGTLVAFDGDSGAFRAFAAPTGENAARTFRTWIVRLHMAAVFGLGMQIFVCLMGLVVAMLSATGVYLWLMKRRAARMRQTRQVR